MVQGEWFRVHGHIWFRMMRCWELDDDLKASSDYLGICAKFEGSLTFGRVCYAMA